MLSIVESKLSELQTQRADKVLRSTTEIAPASQDGCRVVRIENTAALYTGSPFVLNEDGYGFRCAKAGSDPFALKVDLGKAGVFGPVYPGVELRTQTKFDRIAVTPWSSLTVPLAGTFTEAGGYTEDAVELTLIVFKTPEARYYEPEGQGGFVFVRESFNQGYNTTNNTPASFWDGISARGARAIRVVVRDTTSNPITAGTIRWWHMPFGLAVWSYTGVDQPLPLGGVSAAPPELEIAMRGGRLFPELYQYTNQAAEAESPELYMYVYGEGGDLYPGDVP